MAQTWRFYLVREDGDVQGTNDTEIAVVAKRDGSTLVIEPRAAMATYDGDEQDIEGADAADYLDEDLDEDDVDGDETGGTP